MLQQIWALFDSCGTRQGPDCSWFGKQTSCSRFKSMALVTAACAFTLMSASVLMVFTGGQGAMYGQDSRKPRLSLAFRLVALLCELCSLSIALLKVLSDSGLNSDVAFILLSAATSLTSFCLTCIGMSKAWQSLRRVTVRFSTHPLQPGDRVRPAPGAPTSSQQSALASVHDTFADKEALVASWQQNTAMAADASATAAGQEALPPDSLTCVVVEGSP
eukprot:jgi/Ulvmu1/9580/UM054_0010.1